MTHRLDFRWGRGHEASVDAAPEETVLEAAERNGVALPFGCRTGACGTCAGRLAAGDVRYRRPPRALKGHQVRDGFVLTCVARPHADCRFDVGTDVQSRLASNPWKTGRREDGTTERTTTGGNEGVDDRRRNDGDRTTED